MKSAILNFFSLLRESYWSYPLIMAIAAVLLSVITLRIDELIDPKWLENLGWFHPDNPEGARAILTTVATSMITVTSVTFSMTILAVSFAASQIGPRLISNFMRDRANQITLGIFISTFLYAVLILRAVLNDGGILIANENNTAFVPQLSLFLALILTLLSIAVFIYFIHHIPESINMSNVIANVGESLSEQIDYLFPINIGKEAEKKSAKIPKKCQVYREPVKSNSYGYIRILDGNSLINIAAKYELIIELEARPGDFITEGSILLYLCSAKKIDESVHQECMNTFALGYRRNPEQDIFFLINELIEIIARALSPGVNDPFTATTAMDWLQLFLEKRAKRSLPSPYRYDSEEKLRLVAHPVRFDEYCNNIFCGIQPYVSKDRNAARHMMAMIHNIHSNITDSKHKAILVSYAKSLKKAVMANFPAQANCNDIQDLFNKYFG